MRLLAAEPAGRARMVLDTDAWNEIDDQFALVHVLLAADRVDLAAVYAAPFCNSRAASPGEGMRKSEAEPPPGPGRLAGAAGLGRPSPPNSPAAPS